MTFQADNIHNNNIIMDTPWTVVFHDFFPDREYIPDPPYVYTGQVQLGNPDHTLLEIYLENSWRPVCSSRLTQRGAQTACRQLGYTNTASPYPLHFPG